MEHDNRKHAQRQMLRSNIVRPLDMREKNSLFYRKKFCCPPIYSLVFLRNSSNRFSLFFFPSLWVLVFFALFWSRRKKKRNITCRIHGVRDRWVGGQTGGPAQNQHSRLYLFLFFVFLMLVRPEIHSFKKKKKRERVEKRPLKIKLSTL